VGSLGDKVPQKLKHFGYVSSKEVLQWVQGRNPSKGSGGLRRAEAEALWLCFK